MGPALVVPAAGVRFADCIVSACVFAALPGAAPRGTLLLEHCLIEDRVLTRWSAFLAPALAASLLRDMPGVSVLGLGGG